MPSLRCSRGFLCVWLALSLGVSACATTQTAARPAVIEDEAQARYEEAQARFRDEDWASAREIYREVRQQYGNTRWAALAELRLADVDFHEDHFTEALTAYRSWVRYHPSQREAAHARFMIAKCYVAQMPDDWFLVPASYERDLSSAHDAEAALRNFVRDHADADDIDEARRLLRQVRETLARHEMYVATFYASRDRYNAAIIRLQGVVQNFEGSGLESQALLELGEIYLRTHRRDEARGAFAHLVENFPRSAHVDAARRYLALLGQGPTVPFDGSGSEIPESPPGTPSGPETSPPANP